MYLPGLAALLVAVVAGCSGGAGDGSAADPKPGGPTTATAAAPGKYRTLREPCGTVPRPMLQDLLPGADSLPEDQQTKVYEGTASVTYDTDRRVGCSWKADGTVASHQLVIDLERVVSYDPEVSDDDRAQDVYTQKETAAELPPPSTGSGSPSGTPGGSPPATSGTGTGNGAGTGIGTSTGVGTSTGTSAGTDTGTGSTTGTGTNPNTTTQTGSAASLTPSGAPSVSPSET
ncbi:DUF3558 domain-containing protein, partial [Streptomyces odonnellii]|uniref:DUF3558 domain-containing protein n=1 Tax=Streptomyces odonnellii TaxID=1417980 RepID=UPI0012FF1BBD